MDMRISSNCRAICSVIGGILIHLTLGNLYSFGNMSTYMVSYMNHRVDSSITYANFIWVYALIVVSQGLFMIIGGWLEKRIGPRVTCFIGSLILSSGIALTYFSVQYGLGYVIFTYGFMAGLGIALSYVSPLACGMQWYPDKKGLVNGLIVGGFGLGSLGSSTFQTLYLNSHNAHVNPNTNYFDDPKVLDAVPSLFLVMGGIFFVLQLVGCALLSKPSGGQLLGNEIEHLLDSEDETTELNSPDGREVSVDLRPQDLFYRKEFYILWSIYLLNTIGIGFISAMYKSYGQTFISNDMLLSQIGAIAAIFNCGGRLVWGRLMDKTSFKFSMILLTSLLSFLFATTPVTPQVGKFFYAIWVWALFFTFSGTFVLMPTVTEKAFGRRHYVANYGLLFTSQAISGPLLALLSQSMLNEFGYTGSFISVAIVVSGSSVLSCLVPKTL